MHHRVGAEIDGGVVYSNDATWGRWVLTSYPSMGSGSAGLVIFDADGEIAATLSTPPSYPMGE